MKKPVQQADRRQDVETARTAVQDYLTAEVEKRRAELENAARLLGEAGQRREQVGDGARPTVSELRMALLALEGTATDIGRTVIAGESALTWEDADSVVAMADSVKRVLAADCYRDESGS